MSILDDDIDVLNTSDDIVNEKLCNALKLIYPWNSLNKNNKFPDNKISKKEIIAYDSLLNRINIGDWVIYNRPKTYYDGGTYIGKITKITKKSVGIIEKEIYKASNGNEMAYEREALIRNTNIVKINDINRLVKSAIELGLLKLDNVN